MTRGRFITLEGGEGVGKSTQIRALAAAIEARRIEVVATREPGGSAGAEAIRTLLMEGSDDRWDARSEALLFAAARADHVGKTILPALRSGSAPAVGHTFGTRRRPSSPLFQQAAEVVALSSRFRQHNGVVPEVEGKSRRASP